MAKASPVKDLVAGFLDRISEQEKQEIIERRNRNRFDAPPKMLQDMMGSMKRLRRKEMRCEVTCNAKGEQNIELLVNSEYILCPTCLKEIQKAVWLDTGIEAGLIGPWCETCSRQEIQASSHEDGMTYGDSRVYTLDINDQFFIALAVYMAQLPDEVNEGERVARDRITALPMDEQHDDIEDEGLAF